MQLSRGISGFDAVQCMLYNGYLENAFTILPQNKIPLSGEKGELRGKGNLRCLPSVAYDSYPPPSGRDSALLFPNLVIFVFRL